MAENFQFAPCQARNTAGLVQDLPGGFAVVTRGPRFISENVVFIQHQITADLVPGEVARLESEGKARPMR